MWIRSQGKALLIDADRFFVDEESDGRSYIYVNGNPAASYSTHEKAMKVMDRIHGRIECAIKFYETSSILSNESEYVFDMPKDDEVEV